MSIPLHPALRHAFVTELALLNWAAEFDDSTFILYGMENISEPRRGIIRILASIRGGSFAPDVSTSVPVNLCTSERRTAPNHRKQ